MKRLVLLLIFLLFCTGCSGGDFQAKEIRSLISEAEEISFYTDITADYQDHLEQFGLTCRTNRKEGLLFTVDFPREIGGITGTVSGTEGTLGFEDEILVVPLLADSRLSPVMGPWLLCDALSRGNLLSAVQEGALLHISLEHHFNDQEYFAEAWFDGQTLCQGELSWNGRRFLTMEIKDYTLV